MKGGQTRCSVALRRSVLDSLDSGRMGPFFIAVALLLAAGCTRSVNKSAWIEKQGGLVQDMDPSPRLEACLNSLSICLGTRPQLFVLESPAITAHAWSDGSIYLTRGLMTAMDDEQLAAAIAHEIGHLLDEDHLMSVSQWSLPGKSLPLDSEVRADWIGCKLLAAQGLTSEAMTRALERVQQWDGLSTTQQQAIGRRIELLRARYGQVSRHSITDRSAPPALQH